MASREKVPNVLSHWLLGCAHPSFGIPKKDGLYQKKDGHGHKGPFCITHPICYCYVIELTDWRTLQYELSSNLMSILSQSVFSDNGKGPFINYDLGGSTN